MLFAVIDSAEERFDRPPLVPLRLVTRNKFEIHGELGTRCYAYGGLLF